MDSKIFEKCCLSCIIFANLEYVNPNLNIFNFCKFIFVSCKFLGYLGISDIFVSFKPFMTNLSLIEKEKLAKFCFGNI